jgi:tetratricopeptide (TPR) repeat protein
MAQYDPGAALAPFAVAPVNDPSLCARALGRIDAPMAMGDTGGSLSRLRRFISLSCEDAEVIVGRFDRDLLAGAAPTISDIVPIGAMLLQLGQPERAYALWRRAPEVSIYFSEMGRIALENQHDETRGFALFEIADTIDPSFDARKANMYRHQCMAAVKNVVGTTGQYPCETFERAVADSLSALLLGRSRYEQGDYEGATRALRSSVDRDRSAGDAYFWLGRSLSAMGDRTAAMEAYRSGIANASPYPWNYLDLAEIEIERGCYESAQDLLARMSDLGDDEATAAAERVRLGAGDPGTNAGTCN